MEESSGVHWIREGEEIACIGAVPCSGAYLSTPYMSEVTCRACAEIVQQTIDLVGVEPADDCLVPTPPSELSRFDRYVRRGGLVAK